MPALKIAICTKSLRQPLRRALATAKQLGATAVELDARQELPPKELSETGLRQFRKLLSDFELKVAAVSFPTRRGYQTIDELDRRVDATKAAMRLAANLGAPVVVNQVGRIPTETTDAGWGVLTDVLRDLGTFGSHVGAWFAARTGVSSGADLKRLIDALPAGSIAIALDPAALVQHSHPPLDAISELGESIWHVYARDAVRDLSTGRGLEVELGRGSVDFPEILGALEERGYRGAIAIERNDSDDPQHDIRQAVQFLKSL